ncbi:hypothetical protein FCJ61_14985 [Burkholderia metallica]|nr:hypothetical protein [Burkholderia metallica]
MRTACSSAHPVVAPSARANVEHCRFHDVRHTWASWHVRSGAPLERLQERGSSGYDRVLRQRSFCARPSGTTCRIGHRLVPTRDRFPYPNRSPRVIIGRNAMTSRASSF